MPIVVDAMEQERYKQWVADKKTAARGARIDPNKTYTLAELKAQGEKVYPATARPVTRPTAWACRAPSRRSRARK